MSLNGNTAKINELISKINALPEETTPSYQEKTVTPSTSAQTVKPDSGYDALSQVTVNAMPTATQATPSISVSSGGLITASATQTAGYVASGTKSATKQLTVQAAQTITPGTSNKTISSGRYLTGTQTIKGDANLLPANIKKGTSIFGVAGSYEGSGGGSSVGSVETCSGELFPNEPDSVDIFYTGENLTVVEDCVGDMSAFITAIKGSVLVILGSVGEKWCTGVTLLKSGSGYSILSIDSDNFYVDM